MDDLAKKVWITKSTASFMTNKPHKTTTRISKDKVEEFTIAKDSEYMPISLGLVLFMIMAIL